MSREPTILSDDEPPAAGGNPGRAVLAAVRTPEVSEAEFEQSVAELARLGQTLGLQVMGSVTQNRDGLHVATYLGSGKLGELKAALAQHGAGVVLLDHEVSPSQARNLENATGAEVLDRTAVILEIFHRHAR